MGDGDMIAWCFKEDDYAADMCAPPIENSSEIELGLTGEDETSQKVVECIEQTTGLYQKRKDVPPVCNDLVRSWYTDRYESADEAAKFASLMADVRSSAVRNHLREMRQALLQGPVRETLSNYFRSNSATLARLARALSFLIHGFPEDVLIDGQNQQRIHYQLESEYQATMVYVCDKKRVAFRYFRDDIERAYFTSYSYNDETMVKLVSHFEDRCERAWRAWDEIESLVREALHNGGYQEAVVELRLPVTRWEGYGDDHFIVEGEEDFFAKITLYPGSVPIKIPGSFLLDVLQQARHPT